MSIFTAKWISEKNGHESPVFRRRFALGEVKEATLDICGLGWFYCYVNGSAVTDAIFEPAISTYERLKGRKLAYPIADVFAHPRVYYCRYDVTALLQTGENLLSAHLGNGWFNQRRRIGEGDFSVGVPRLCYSLTVTYADGSTVTIESDESTLAAPSEIEENNIYYGERQNLGKRADYHAPGFDESDFAPAVQAEKPEGELSLYDYPRERVIRHVLPKLVSQKDGVSLYDLGENLSGRLRFETAYAGMIRIQHAEELTADGKLDFSFSGGEGQIQACEYIGDGRRHENVHPLFSYQCCRYLAVMGEIENPVFEVIHTDLARTGDFRCEDERINRLLDVYMRTQLNAIHGCVPVDCPHRERLGYTGDGQITAETVMHLFDARGFYRKWMDDIADCQNRENGRIQHTAPFGGGGGGPAGWGGAAIVLPYTYFEMYGDGDFVRRYLGVMQSYLSYMESRCEDGLVTWEERGGWFLGDWCFTDCKPNDDTYLPPIYVNTCYLVKFYRQMLTLDAELSLGLPRDTYLAAIQMHEQAILGRYYNAATGDFCGNLRGANLFALDIGLGDARTRSHVIDTYSALGGFDTGIFGTEILIRLLDEWGEIELLHRLLTSEKKDGSFGYMMASGATTLWEDWDGANSHCHPMFGGCLKALWTAFLGIRRVSAGYQRIEIAPADLPVLGRMEGYITTPNGRLSVTLTREEDAIAILVNLPPATAATLTFRGKQTDLEEGENIFLYY